MKFEEYYELLLPIIKTNIKQFSGLRMEPEDLIQEASILIYNKIDKLDAIDTIEGKCKYFKTCLNGLFKNINIKEHEQLLNVTSSYSMSKHDGSDEAIIDYIDNSNIDIDYKDEFLEHIYEVRRENLKRWRKENHEHILEYDRKYRDEHRERYRELNRNYYNRHKEEINKKRRENIDVINAKRRAKYQEHKDEYNAKRREQYRLKKLAELENNMIIA